MAKKVKLYDRQLADLVELQGLSDLPREALQEVVKKLLFDNFATLYGFNVTPTSPASGSVTLSVSLGVDDGNIIDVATPQTVRIISGSSGWGTPQTAHGTHPRWSIVCLKYATQDTDPAAKWFINDTSEYQTTVTTRIQDYFDIAVVHGSAAATPTKPTTPAGYTKIADVYVPAGATSVNSGNITRTAPEPSKTLQQIAAEIGDHNHDTRYYTKTEADGAFTKKAYATVKVGGVSVVAGTKEDLFELVAGGAVTLSADAASKKITISASSGVSHHNQLQGLTADDHTQYLNTTRHGNITGNPHATEHGQLGSILQVDPASTNTSRNKHVSNADAKNWEDHRNATLPHMFVGASAPNSATYKLWYDTGVNTLKFWNGTIWEVPNTYQ